MPRAPLRAGALFALLPAVALDAVLAAIRAIRHFPRNVEDLLTIYRNIL